MGYHFFWFLLELCSLSLIFVVVSVVVAAAVAAVVVILILQTISI